VCWGEERLVHRSETDGLERKAVETRGGKHTQILARPPPVSRGDKKNSKRYTLQTRGASGLSWGGGRSQSKADNSGGSG
jgi:hypothetical protein